MNPPETPISIELFDAARIRSDVSTKTEDAFLNSAERIFAVYGYEGTTVRAIAEDAGVQLGALHYYWGSKECMFQAVLERRLRPVAEQRIERLDSTLVASDGAPTVAQILDAYYAPMIALAERDELFLKFVFRTLTDPAPEVRRAYGHLTLEAGFRFVRLLRKACAHLDEVTFFWRLSSILGGMMYVICNRVEDELKTSASVKLDDIAAGARESLAGFCLILEAPSRRPHFVRGKTRAGPEPSSRRRPRGRAD